MTKIENISSSSKISS